MENLSESQLRELSAQLLVQLASNSREIVYRQTNIDKLTHEIAILTPGVFTGERHLMTKAMKRPDEACLIEPPCGQPNAEAMVHQHLHAIGSTAPAIPYKCNVSY